MTFLAPTVSSRPRAAQPPLMRHTPIQVSWFGQAPFLRPDLTLAGRRAQPQSRMAAGHRRRRREASLTAASTAPGSIRLGDEAPDARVNSPRKAAKS